MNENTIASCLQLSPQLAAVSDSPRLDIELLLSHCLNKNRTYLFTWPETVLSESQSNLFNDCFLRRLAGEPIAHIIGTREFWSLPLMVNTSTLIPRPDTELLVESVLNLFAPDDRSTKDILDLGTGTGAILLALAHEKPHWRCVGVDKEIAAVELAEVNRQQLNLNNVRVLQSDWFSAMDQQARFDVIVSNPPYIDAKDPHLLAGDVRFEPHSALVAAQNGMADLILIATQARSFLKPNGWLLLEHGFQQGDAVRRLLQENCYQKISTLRDFGGNERVTFATFSGAL